MTKPARVGLMVRLGRWLFAGVLVTHAMLLEAADRSPESLLLPVPASIEATGGTFTLEKDTPIVVSGGEPAGEAPQPEAHSLRLDERREDWRREWDSNPRYGYPYDGFQDRCLKPLGHPSTGQCTRPSEHRWLRDCMVVGGVSLASAFGTRA